MSRKINKEILSDLSDNTAFKSTASKFPDLSQNTLLSKDNSKKLSDKKSNSSKKMVSEKSVSKKLKKSEDSIYNLDNLENDVDYSANLEKKKSKTKKERKNKSKNNNR